MDARINRGRELVAAEDAAPSLVPPTDELVVPSIERVIYVLPEDRDIPIE